MKKKPKAAKNWMAIDSEPALNPRSRNNRGSRSGLFWRSSHSTKSAPATRPSASDPTVTVSVQPRSGASMMPNTRAATVTSESTPPTTSSAGGSASAERGTTANTPAKATADRTTLNAKNDCHDGVGVDDRPGKSQEAGSMARTRGRRPGGLDTRSAIVVEARRQFGEAGYAPTTLRGIAAGAGVDPRLVLHYFGSKRGLFLEAVELPVDASVVVSRALRGDSGTVGERVADLVLSVLDDPASRQVLMGILRSAVTDPEAAELVRDLLSERLLLPIAREVAADHPELRAALVASQFVGLALARHVVGLGPLASASREALIAGLAPALTHYLEGPWTQAEGDGAGAPASPAG